MKNIANLDKVLKIEIHYQKINPYYFYKPNKWGVFGIMDAGIYTSINIIPKKVNELPTCLKFEEEKIYSMPYIGIVFTGWETEYVYFQTNKELDAFIEENVKGIKTITYDTK